MEYEKELKFVESFLKNYRINTCYIDSRHTSGNLEVPAVNLQDIFNYPIKEEDILSMLKKYCEDNTIYQVEDEFMCHYLLFKLPDIDHPVYMSIGPYSTRPINKQNISKLADEYRLAPGMIKQLEQFYMDIPIFPDENTLIVLFNTLAASMWGGIDNYSIKRKDDFFIVDKKSITPLPDILTPEEAFVSMQLLEQRYSLEQQLIQAIAAGQTHKAELYFSNFTTRQFERRTAVSLRDRKNYLIVLNTLLRLAAELGAVHPIHIDHISSKYAHEIEALTSEENGANLAREMVRKYCLLVKNHSLKQYSLLIRKVITNIDNDLTADLSLKSQAELLNVNPSYLSTLFKKETGVTLTEYVNRKRIEHALLLLNSKDIQIQTIAQYCGISDVNYFTKLFKKHIGQTPKEYRQTISPKF